MKALVFMPWCQIDRTYRLNGVSLLLFEREMPISGLDEDEERQVRSIFESFKTIEGDPVDGGTIVSIRGDSPISEYSQDETESIAEFVELACFSALANREYFTPFGPYCNSDCFSLYSQRLDGSELVALVTRRRDGRTVDTWPRESVTITMPVHCAAAREVKPNSRLMTALLEFGSRSKNGEWPRWQSALACFNQANTDSDNIRYQVEWVLLCSAFEHILRARPKAQDVASRFATVLVPQDEVLVHDADRRGEHWSESGQSLRYEWMREFYRVRGDLAHGKLYSKQPVVWSPGEHLLLATIAFPLVVKCLLMKEDLYELTNDDKAQIEAFEHYANTADFLKPPSDQQNSSDTEWQRLLQDRRFSIDFETAFEQAWVEQGPPTEEE